MDNHYLPMMAEIREIVDQTHDVRTLRLRLKSADDIESFRWQAGQFGLFSAFGEGESTFCIGNPPTRPGHIEITFKQAGRVTSALRQLDVGDTIGVRGPYGNAFPIDDVFRGRDVVFVGGGIGIAPVRAVYLNCLDRRDEFGRLMIIGGARTADDFPFLDETCALAGAGHEVTVGVTIDPGRESSNWPHRVGLVPDVLREMVEQASPAVNTAEAVAIVCGPPVMIKFTLPVLHSLGFADERVYTTLENRMKCGIGKCGRCNVGSRYVCKDGPVFTAAELHRLPNDL